jgi:hypothetical protein
VKHGRDIFLGFVLVLLFFALLLLMDAADAQPLARRVGLPLVANGQAQPTPAPRAAYDLRPPPGIRCFHHDTLPVEALDGAIYWNSQCMDGRGQLVFRTDAAGTTLVLPSTMGGTGRLFVGRDGWLYLSTGSYDIEPRFTRVEPVPGWRRP